MLLPQASTIQLQEMEILSTWMVYFPPETICFRLLLIQGLLQDLIEELSMIINISEAVTIKPSWYAVILTCLTTLTFVRKWNFSVKKDGSAF